MRGQLDLVYELALDYYDSLVENGISPRGASQHARQRYGLLPNEFEAALSERLRARMLDAPAAACSGGHCGGRNAATPDLHTCPYANDVHNDPTPRCRCCDVCQDGCARDI